jgi:ribosomal protein S18 acetylase RimI-like enzyme
MMEPVRNGDVAAIVTFLDMTKRPAIEVPASRLSLRRVENPDVDHYRDLYRLVGARWLWNYRLTLGDEALHSLIATPGVELFEVVDGDAVVGMLELDFATDGECEIKFLGLTPELSGQGHGNWLFAETLQRAWRDGVKRVHVNTCTLDHPAALSAYRNAGFRAYERKVETYRDPRLTGVLPRDCAPQLPLIEELPDS